MAKNRYIRQLNTQQKKVTKASDKTRLLTLENSSYARRVTADLRLSAECESRDRIQQRIDIIEKWMEEFENER
jgi:5'-deoxynucleotidase YfbR-like HD superfamily hydrolase